MIRRKLQEHIKAKMFKDKVIIVLGARQVGKTTLLSKLIGAYENIPSLNADDEDVRTLFDHPSSSFF